MNGADTMSARSHGDATIAALLRWAIERLKGLGSAARSDALDLLRDVVSIDRATAYAHFDRVLDRDAAAAFRAAIERRRSGEPVAYITGRRGFHALELGVNENVLVPRPESELLVDTTLTLAPPNSAFAVLDLGTGSGALALAILFARRDAFVVGADASAAALEVARANARFLGLEVRWVESDWYAGLQGERFDFVVCNPPYVRSDDPHMRMLAHEPRLALDGGADGLSAIRSVLRDIADHLSPDGSLLLEHGFDQALAVARIARDSGLAVRRVVRDLGGHDRVSVIGVD